MVFYFYSKSVKDSFKSKTTINRFQFITNFSLQALGNDLSNLSYLITADALNF